jgi:hypothetical protein
VENENRLARGGDVLDDPVEGVWKVIADDQRRRVATRRLFDKFRVVLVKIGRIGAGDPLSAPRSFAASSPPFFIAPKNGSQSGPPSMMMEILSSARTGANPTPIASALKQARAVTVFNSFRNAIFILPSAPNPIRQRKK